MRTIPFPNKPMYDITLLALLLAVFFVFCLGERPYSAPSEARYVEIGREMAQSGDWVTPRLDYVKYFEKPPLFYWIQAASTKFLGLDTFKARLPTAAFALCLCLLTYGLTRMLYGRLAGWLGTLTLATSLYLFALSRIVLLDVPVSVFMTATLTAFLYVVNAAKGSQRTLILYLMYAAAACAVLTKGLIGIILPGIVVFLWLACTKRWRVLSELRIPSGIALFLLISIPWHVLVSLRNPEFPHFYFIHEHFERYTTREHGRYQPDWFFIPVLLVGLFPWIVYLYQALKSGLTGFWEDRKEDGSALFLVLWTGFIFFFFSLSDSKLIPYILPVFPPLAALLGRYFALAWREFKVQGFALGLLGMILLLAATAGLLLTLPGLLSPDSKVIEALTQAGDEIHTFCIVCMVSAGTLLVVYIQGQKRHVIIAMLLAAAIVIQFGNMVSTHYDKDSMLILSSVIQSVDRPGDEVATYENYDQDLPIYLKRRITLVNWKGELAFGSEHEDTSRWIIDDKELWKRWNTPGHLMFVIMRLDSYQRLTQNKTMAALHLNMLYQSGRNLLFSNQPAESLKKK